MKKISTLENGFGGICFDVVFGARQRLCAELILIIIAGTVYSLSPTIAMPTYRQSSPWAAFVSRRVTSHAQRFISPALACLFGRGLLPTFHPSDCHG